MSNDMGPRRLRRWEIGGLVAIAVLMAWDLAIDYAEGTGWIHIAVEMLVLLIAAAGAVLLLWQLRETRERLSVATEQAQRWREENRELMEGLGSAIARQFRRWQLTAAEAEIGFLLLKGMSHKQIANARGTSERTVREQSRSVYRKAGLQGRADLSAFFLENIMLPDEPGRNPRLPLADSSEPGNGTTAG
jgi:DNA-binding CsgD family transcriptional regulator